MRSRFSSTLVDSGGRADTHDQLAASVPIPIMRHLRVSTSRASLSSDEDESTPQPQDMQVFQTGRGQLCILPAVISCCHLLPH